MNSENDKDAPNDSGGESSANYMISESGEQPEYKGKKLVLVQLQIKLKKK